MKTILLSLLLFVINALPAQNPVGKSQAEVKTEIQKKYKSSDISEGTFDDTKQHWICVNDKTWYVFDKGVCSKYSMRVPSAELSKMIARLNDNKALKYDNAKKGWVNAAKQYTWSIKNNDEMQWAEITCKKF